MSSLSFGGARQQQQQQLMSQPPVPGGKSAKLPTVIEAKPQMRNLSADLTRFVPTTLKMKKDTPMVKKEAPKTSGAPKIEWRTPQVPVNFF